MLKVLQQFKIEAVHSRWGIFQLTARKVDAGHGGYWEFWYPNGEYMGSLEPSAGGFLGHPHYEVQRFLRFYKEAKLPTFKVSDCTLEFDDAGYTELESLLMLLISENDPDYWDEDVTVPTEVVVAPPISK